MTRSPGQGRSWDIILDLIKCLLMTAKSIYNLLLGWTRNEVSSSLDWFPPFNFKSSNSRKFSKLSVKKHNDNLYGLSGWDLSLFNTRGLSWLLICMYVWWREQSFPVLCKTAKYLRKFEEINFIYNLYHWNLITNLNLMADFLRKGELCRLSSRKRKDKELYPWCLRSDKWLGWCLELFSSISSSPRSVP